MYCEKPPEPAICRCKNCVLRQPDNVPWIDVLSLNMAEKDDIIRRISSTTRRSMESLASDASEPKKLGVDETQDQEPYNPSTAEPLEESPPPQPPPPPQPTILLIVVNKPEASSSAMRGYPGCSAAPQGYPGSGPECSCPGTRGPPGSGHEYPCPGARGPPGPGPEYPYPGARGYSGPGPGYPYPGARGPPNPGPRYHYPEVERPSRPLYPNLEARSSSPGPRRFPVRSGSPKRFYNVPPGPAQRSGYDERFRYTSKRSPPKWYQVSPMGQPRRYSNNGNADTSRNRGSSSLPRCCRCEWPRSEDRNKTVERIRSDNTLDSVGTKGSSSEVIKPVGRKSIESRLGGSGYTTRNTNACHTDQQPPESNVCKGGSCRSNLSIKSKAQRNSRGNCSKWENQEEMQEVVVTDNTKKTFRCIQVPICISVGKPANCPGCKCDTLPKCEILPQCGNCANSRNCGRCANCGICCENFDCYSQTGTLSDDDEDKRSCSSQGTDSCNSQCNSPCNSQGRGSLNSQNTSSSDSQSKCSSYSSSCETQGVCDMATLPEEKEPKEANSFACNLSDLERTLRCLVPNTDCMCYLKKKKLTRRRRKKKSPKVCYDRFANPPIVFYPKPKYLDYGASPFGNVCFNPCCCDPLGMTTYNMDYCCRPGYGCC